MSQFKKHWVVMLPTQDKAPIALGENDLMIYNRFGMDYIPNQNDSFTNHHIYVLSDNKIEDGDWYYHGSLKLIGQAKVILKKNNPEWRKIIATTDKLICDYTEITHPTHDNSRPILLPQLSLNFIEEFVSDYNKGNPITHALVEMRCGCGGNPHKMGCEAKDDSNLFVKINPKDNTIIIKKCKDNYNREEVESLIRKVWNKAALYGFQNENSKHYLDDWIKNNL
jgi:hypothetical protein